MLLSYFRFLWAHNLATTTDILRMIDDDRGSSCQQPMHLTSSINLLFFSSIASIGEADGVHGHQCRF